MKSCKMSVCVKEEWEMDWYW